MMETKRCSACKELKPITDFYKNKSKRDGYGNDCKPCDKQRTKKWVEDNPERRYEIARSYYDKNKEIVIERSRTQRIEHREETNELKRNWAKNNPEKVLASGRKARADRTKAKGVSIITAREWAEVVEAHGGLCFWCGNDSECQDHYYPLNPRNGEEPGTHTIDNVVPACTSCNCKKSNKNPIDFMMEMWTLKA